ncbi:hypothetical protein BOTBODRAFT_31819 [Botryobasidium botryosum FD-172 SS1]|uniref:Alpha-ketoglutarate-dependent dioxygenase AlkB-like domain-containing protein n=1 Tax=Botryobasidium botryosum (strain FD-172 SS1) TaxID=930990 RepID=A0A067MIA1_BOTB1|nr:hypothetical protein BOTBODRAFT_31819 [Botryobasidium botryosum FD-172 SS1]
MDFEREASGDRRSIWLPSRSVIVLEGEARYEWTHGIAERRVDLVDAEDGPPAPGMWIERGTRVSITLRWLLPGADVVGS